MFCLSNRVIAVQSVKDLKIPLNHLADNVLFEQLGYRCTKRSHSLGCYAKLIPVFKKKKKKKKLNY